VQYVRVRTNLASKFVLICSRLFSFEEMKQTLRFQTSSAFHCCRMETMAVFHWDQPFSVGLVDQFLQPAQSAAQSQFENG